MALHGLQKLRIQQKIGVDISVFALVNCFRYDSVNDLRLIDAFYSVPLFGSLPPCIKAVTLGEVFV
ncbi:hypothetical protein H5410_019200 [Solanum commersonii]|uniref:Uncharacterized protein n=1 Tax=Solanum commersonii TaxID=4109 RepID=A0A9J6A4S3_SOLCO|nr:hypothetical protein H5410_019200 [Solanum commersonii]